MAERVYRTEGLILRRNDFSEADRLVLLATPLGKRRVIAKGVRKITSRLAGHIELFTHTNMLLAVGRNLDIITQSQALASFTTLRNDLTRLSYAYYIAELYDQFTQEEEENRPLFQLLVQIFTALDTSRNPDLALRWFELRLLQYIGYRPHMHHCTVCHETLTEQAERFSPILGGMLCPRDSPADRNALPLSNAGFRLLRYLQSQPLETVEQMGISRAVRNEVERVLRAYVRFLLERDLKSVAFLEMVRDAH